MRNIGITTFVTLLLGTAIIGNGHVVLAHTRDFSNSGNYLVNDQNCTAGNSCNLSSSNTVTGSSGGGLTSPTPTPTTLSLNVNLVDPENAGNGDLTGHLGQANGPQTGRATITFTGVMQGKNMPVGQTTTDQFGNYLLSVSSDTLLEFSSFTANAGAPAVIVPGLAPAEATAPGPGPP